jgi:hypothetical protein
MSSLSPCRLNGGSGTALLCSHIYIYIWFHVFYTSVKLGLSLSENLYYERFTALNEYLYPEPYLKLRPHDVRDICDEYHPKSASLSSQFDVLHTITTMCKASLLWNICVFVTFRVEKPTMCSSRFWMWMNNERKEKIMHRLRKER